MIFKVNYYILWFYDMILWVYNLLQRIISSVTGSSYEWKSCSFPFGQIQQCNIILNSCKTFLSRFNFPCRFSGSRGLSWNFFFLLCDCHKQVIIFQCDFFFFLRGMWGVGKVIHILRKEKQKMREQNSRVLKVLYLIPFPIISQHLWSKYEMWLQLTGSLTKSADLS